MLDELKTNKNLKTNGGVKNTEWGVFLLSFSILSSVLQVTRWLF